MTTSAAEERIYVVGATGNVGSVVVKELLKNKIPVTVYARSPEKAAGLFGNDSNLTIVQGDNSDLKPLEDSIAGHTRLLLVVNDFKNLAKIKVSIAQIAYAAGIKQIVHISSMSVSFPWRSGSVSTSHRLAEEGILAIPGRGAYVTLRPSRFMSNIVLFDGPGIKFANMISDTVPLHSLQQWISPNDIGLAAVNIFRDPIEKHGDAVYEMTGESVSPAKRAELLTKSLGRPIIYRQVTEEERYKTFVEQAGLPHTFAFDLLKQPDEQKGYKVSPGISILLGRAPETLEQWLEANKASLL